MRSVKIFTNSGLGIGLGHIVRCKALKDEFIRKGYKVELFDFVAKEHNNLAEHWCKKRFSFANDIVIIDSYLYDERWLSSLQTRNCLIVVIDDDNRIYYHANLIINPNVYGPDIDYSSQSAEIISGSEYTILRDAFYSVSPSNYSIKKRSILVTLGGNDYRGLLPGIIDCLSNRKDVSLTVIDPREQAPLYPGVRYLGFLGVDSMLREFMEAEVVITGCGQTLHELALLAKKCIAVCIDSNQRLNQNYYLNIGLIKDELHWDDDNLYETISEISELKFKEKNVDPNTDIASRKGVEQIIKRIESYGKSKK